MIRVVAHPRVLIVDDEPLIGRALQRGLHGYDVTLATDGRQVLEWLAAGRQFDVIVCDVMMPVMDGCQLHAEITRLFPAHAARMIFMTGSATTATAQEFVEAVRNPVLDKPFDLEVLRATIRSLLRAR
jgi:CheY-like chemotaxis protein